MNVHTQLASIQYLRDPSTEIPKPVLKQHRDKVVESLMKWMQVPESCGMDVTVEVEMAVGVCGLVIRLTRDDRVLGNAFKLLFKLSKSGANDGAFGRYNIPDGISLYLNHLTTDKRLLIAHKCDMAIYAVATLKNLTTGGELSFESEKDTEPLISIMSRMMWFLIKNDAITSKTSQQRVSQTIQLFIQITLTFRNLLTLHQSQTQTQLLTPIPCDTMSASTKPLEVLITILSTPGLLESQELLLTVSRILSKISLDETCLSAMSSLKTWNKLVDLVIQFQNKKIDPQPLLVRLLFVLGNLSTPNDVDPVQQDYTEYCDDFVALFWKYGKRVARDLRKEIGYACSMNGDGGLEEEDGFESSESVDEESSVLDGGKKGKHGKRRVSDFVVECEDVLIKITRLISNMSIHPPSGEQMSQMIELELMLQLLELACASESSLVRHEELVLNLAGALANFTFYQNEQNCLFQQSIQVLELMLPLLLHENNELVDQATRVYSNLSRPSNSIDSSDNSIYNWMAQHRGGVELLTILLEHPSRSILINVCGTLLNLFCLSTVSRKGPFQCAMTLVKCGGIHKLLDLVQQALSDGDLVCTSVACKSLVCLIELQEASGEEWLTDEEEERLGMLMIGYLDIVDPPLMDPPPLLRMQSQQDLFKGVECEEASHLHNARERDEDKISGEEKELIAVAKRVLHVLGCNGDINDALLDEGPEIDPRISIRKEVGI
ncbi:Armadillo repeat-containing protein 2 [Rhizoclosmatium sp. JEL0117]|nr:Armadillo repeat-containing protein 2 [Rhizoclosmatium sp. JEL0117]